jgi:hypothetical protein
MYWMHFVSIYQNRGMKPVETALRRRWGQERIIMGGVNLTKIY